jgi:hypothetical protein
MIKQPRGNPEIDVPNWELRSGIYYGDSRVSAFDDEDNFMVDHTQVAVLGTSDIPPPVNFQKKFSHCTADPKQDLAILVEDGRDK